MAKRGRKPKSTSTKRLEGNPGKRPLNENEPRPDPSLPAPPDHLDSVAIAEWGRLAPEMNRIGILTQVDRAAFAAYCCAYARWVHAEEAIGELRQKGENPYVVTTEKGNRVQDPIVGISNKAMELMLRYMAEFGLTPSSRSRVSVPRSEPDEFDREFGAAEPPVEERAASAADAAETA